MSVRRSVISLTIVAFSSWLVGACASADAVMGTPTPAFAGRSGSPCTQTRDCMQYNEICVAVGDGGTEKTCNPPPNGGRCSPGTTNETATCYPDARCQPVATTVAGMTGLCSFQPVPAPIFNFDRRTPKISVTAPNTETELRPVDGIRLSWVPPAVSADTVVVAVVMKSFPQREGLSNRISNIADIQWIWSSTAPGTSTQPGNVPLEAGRRSINPDGSLGQPYATNILVPGRYWWFVYAMRNGVVVTASDILNFRVGTDNAVVSCADVNQCAAAYRGHPADTLACIDSKCMHRCASDLDCSGIGTRCNTTRALTSAETTTLRRGGYCEQIPTGTL
jgi:hypothetical protein